MKYLGVLIANQMVRFMLMGGLSTLLMLLLHMLLTLFIPAQVAYFLSYFITVILLYIMSSFYVFKNHLSWKTFVSFSGVYLGQYLVGAVLLEVMIRFGFSPIYSPLFILMGLLPLTFLMTRLALSLKKPPSPDAEPRL